ncbi:MAG: endonuclease/exonuclease/phosphatase family protein [Burkholderiaceae bacterium]
MAKIRFMVWNMEWMNDLFQAGTPARFRPDGEKPQHFDTGVTIAKRKADLRGVLTELAPDVLVIVEGPSETAELQLFFDDWQPGVWQCHLQKTRSSTQNVGIAVRAASGLFAPTALTPFNTGATGVFDDFIVDVDDDGVDESYRFERRPLHAQVNLADGSGFRVLGVHLKSKAIFDSYEWSKWWQVADGNRRRILAQASHIRANFIEPFLTDAETRSIPLIVCGDVNDGPGLDASEKRLFGSGIERLMASVWQPHLSLRNALFDTLDPRKQKKLDFETLATTRFRDPLFNSMTHREWIDHILYSANRAAPWVSNGRVAAHAADGTAFWSRFKNASDHSPVMADLDL